MPDDPTFDERPLRPELGSSDDLPEPWVRLAMARSRSNIPRPPHSKLGMVALVMAALSALGLVAGAFKLCSEMSHFEQLGRDATFLDALRNHSFSFKLVVVGLLLTFGLSFLLGAFSLLFRGTRKATGWWAIGVVLSTAVLLIAILADTTINTVLTMRGK